MLNVLSINTVESLIAGEVLRIFLTKVLSSILNG